MQQKINTAAVTLFELHGNNFTLDQLSKQAQTSRATLYRRIGSKDILLKNLNKQGLIKLNSQPDIKARILTATRKIVAEYGFINCTMEQISAEASLGIATLYRHFSDKENLLLAFTTELKADVSITEFEMADNLSVEDGLFILIKAMLKFIEDNADIVKILFFGNPEERKYINNIRDASSSTFKLISKYIHKLKTQNLVQTNIKAEDLVASLMGQLLQFALTAPLNLGRELNIERDAKLITQIFCNGLMVVDKEAI